MDVRIDRRAFLREIGGVATGAAATSFTACGGRADRKTNDAGSSKTLVVRDIGGAYGEANRKAVYEPFSKETGIQVNVVNIPLDAQMLAQIKEGRPEFDVIDIDMSALARPEGDEATQELDYDRLKSARNAGIAESLLTSHGVGKNYWASVMAFRTDAFGGKARQSWADFWDTGAFPGSRALQSPDAGPPELECALLAESPSRWTSSVAVRPGDDSGGITGATCLYAIYDPVAGLCSLARSGHPGPALVHPGGTVEQLQVPVSPPLGLGGGLPFESAEFTLSEGSRLVLYTDGLIEDRNRDIDTGLEMLHDALAGPGRTPEETCQAVLDALLPARPSDDIALLVARSRLLDPSQVADWDVPGDPAAVAGIRADVARRLEE